MARREILYPYDADGNLLHYAKQQVRGYVLPESYQAQEWRPGAEFTATLVIDHSISGMSAKYFMWKSMEPRWYPMFATDLVDLAQRGQITRGVASGVWAPRKRGSNFGVRFVREA